MSRDIEEVEAEFARKLSGLSGRLGKDVAMKFAALSTFYKGPIPPELGVAVWNDSRVRARGESLGEGRGAVRDYIDYVFSAMDKIGAGYGDRVPEDKREEFIAQVAEIAGRYQLGDFQKTMTREEEGEEDE